MKTPLIERMEKKGAPKSWIKEIQTKDKRIEQLLELKETYLNIIDRLAREKEQLEDMLRRNEKKQTGREPKRDCRGT